MLFWLKKFVTFWLMPLPFCVTLLVVGLWLTRSAKRARFGRALLIAATALLVLFSNKFMSQSLIGSLETRYPAIPELHEGAPLPAALAGCRFVVVLGAGHSDTPGLASTHKLSDSALGRIVEGVRLLRALPAARLVISGPPVGTNPSHATVLAQAAESLGVGRDRILYVDTARDTEDEANAVKKIAGDSPVALVTSAWHMPRAAALFHHAGVHALPCPADFKGKPNADFRWEDLTWDTESLGRSTAAIHEQLGYLWIWLRGKT